MQCVLLSAVLACVLAATWADPTHKSQDHDEYFTERPAQYDHHMHILREHFKHMAEIGKFTCHKPQSRAVSIGKLLPGQERYKSFIPDVTVQLVCDYSCGICPTKGHVCAPTRFNIIKRTFKVTYLQDYEGYFKGDRVYEQFDFKDHTECSCQDRSLHLAGSTQL